MEKILSTQDLEIKIAEVVPVENVSDVTAIVAGEVEKKDQIIKQQTLGRRKKYAETPEVLSETGMTIEQVREFNAYSDGYNDRAKQLQDALLPPEPVAVVEPIAEPVVIEEPVVIPEDVV